MSPDIAIALSSAVVAIAALVVSVWQGVVTRNHNRLSVRPFVSIDWHVRPGMIRAAMRNRGAGPAIIQALNVFVRGTRVEGEFPTLWMAAVTDLGLTVRCQGYRVFPSTALASGEEIDLLRFPETETNVALAEEAAEKLRLLRIEIEYTSIYGESFTSSSAPELILK